MSSTSQTRTPHTVSDLKPKHRVTLFPSLGYLTPTGAVHADVHGRVYTEGKVPLGTRLLLKALKRAMKASPDEFASETFRTRIDGFLAAPGRRRKIVLQIEDQNYRLQRRTRRDGTFFGTLELPKNLASRLAPSQTQVAIPMQLLRSQDATGAIEASEGLIHFAPQHGVSVISDIDDTIKLTGATDRKEMLNNTFLRPFKNVEGMADLYKTWQQQGCAFHYVSSSPWQLYEPLAEHCIDSNFPAGSMHLRYFRVRDEMFKRFRMVRRHTKVGIIARILRSIPNRRYILIGDSGEKDPEIYRFLARRFPNRVAAILIRQLPSRPLSGKRREKLKLNNLPVPVQIFEDTSEIADVVERIQSTQPT